MIPGKQHCHSLLVQYQYITLNTPFCMHYNRRLLDVFFVFRFGVALYCNSLSAVSFNA